MTERNLINDGSGHKMRTLFLDIETYAPTPIQHGVYKYAEDVEVLLIAYAYDDEPVRVEQPDELSAVLEDQTDVERVVIHNSNFERTVLARAKNYRLELPISKIYDTMAEALLRALPASLDALCKALGAPSDKMKDARGKKLISLFTSPHKAGKGGRCTKDTHPVEWQEFIAYASQDVEAMRWAYHRMPARFLPEEHLIWELDQRINDRGVQIDTRLAKGATEAVALAQAALTEELQQLTGGAVRSATQRDALLRYLRDVHAFEPADLRRASVEALLASKNTPAAVCDILRVRAQASTSSTAKYFRLLESVGTDGRLRGALQYCGASRTGRWAGRIFQPQNLPRPKVPKEEIPLGVEAIRTGCAHLITDDVMALVSSCLRGVIVAPEGKKLVISDLANIEGRVLAWLAGESWKLQAYKEYDAKTGHDLYRLAFARAFGVAPENVTSEQRQLGKVMELALGYQGSVGAFAKMSAGSGVSLPEEQVLRLVRAWRESNPCIVNFWWALERAFRAAMSTDTAQRVWSVGKVRIVRVSSPHSMVCILLPSGRPLLYHRPFMKDGTIYFWGVGDTPPKWGALDTYSGKLAENITQAVARDVMATNMAAVEDAGYAIVLTVHDELISETPDNDAFNVATLSALLSRQPAWAEGLPLAAGGFETKRYRKD